MGREWARASFVRSPSPRPKSATQARELRRSTAGTRSPCTRRLSPSTVTVRRTHGVAFGGESRGPSSRANERTALGIPRPFSGCQRRSLSKPFRVRRANDVDFGCGERRRRRVAPSLDSASMFWVGRVTTTVSLGAELDERWFAVHTRNVDTWVPDRGSTELEGESARAGRDVDAEFGGCAGAAVEDDAAASRVERGRRGRRIEPVRDARSGGARGPVACLTSPALPSTQRPRDPRDLWGPWDPRLSTSREQGLALGGVGCGIFFERGRSLGPAAWLGAESRRSWSSKMGGTAGVATTEG